MTLDEDQALADYLRAARKTTQAEADALHEDRPLLRYEPHFSDAATASAH